MYFLAGIAGFEPAHDGVKVRCLTAWRYPNIWGGRWDSNPRQPEPQSGALPTELRPPYGAGDGNRTHATSLEGWSSTIELHPQDWSG